MELLLVIKAINSIDIFEFKKRLLPLPDYSTRKDGLCFFGMRSLKPLMSVTSSQVKANILTRFK